MTRANRAGEQAEEWIRAIAELYPDIALEPAKRLEGLMDALVSAAPQKVVEFIKKQRAAGERPPVFSQAFVNKLARHLLSLQATEDLEEFLRLCADWDVQVESEIHQQLGRAYVNTGSLAKARESFQKARARAHADPSPLRGLYEVAKKEYRATEAHALLSELAQADPCVATVTFAYKERRKLPEPGHRPVRIALLSSYLLDPLIPYLDLECRKAALAPEFFIAPFNQYAQQILDADSRLYQFQPEITFVAVALEDLFPDVAQAPPAERLAQATHDLVGHVTMLVRELDARCGGIVVVHDFVGVRTSPYGILDGKSPNGLIRWVHNLNATLVDSLRPLERAYVMPLDEVVASVGRDRTLDPKMQYMASMRLGEAALPELARYSMRYVKPLKGLTRKCVVLDLDNTLWGGVVGEVGPDGIHLGPSAPGAEFVDFQKSLLNLTRKGVLLAVCSKNNPDDALEVIRGHQYMILREEHFGAMRINWDNKAENLRQIATELNIGLDALVFIDDNPAERELVRQLLPEVLTPEVPTDPSRYRAMLESLSDFELLAITREDETRAAQYQALAKRRAAKSESASLEQYLYSLELKARISYAKPELLSRLVQMFNKTNQFNLTTRRYQAAELEGYLESPQHRVYALEVSDRFGDQGTVGAAIIKEEDERWHIDSLLMSCRVMGLSIETAFLHRIWQDARQAGIGTLLGEFVPTAKNHPVKDFYSQHGFVPVRGDDTCQQWQLKVNADRVMCPGWIEIKS